MPGRKAQIAIEYLMITGVILTVAVTVFTYSYVSNSQSIRVNQANNAVERITNIADLVYALGPGNSQFVEVTFPQGIELIQDITVCKGAGGTYQNHYGEGEPSCPGDEVKAGAVEMRLSLIGGPENIRSSSKAEIEMDVALPEETVQPTMGKHIIKVYWCGEKICISKTEHAVSEECLNGQTRDCPLKNADCLANPDTCTCTEALEVCIGGVWPGCEKETYQDYNASYEQTETSCDDGIDNDCDSLIDCDDRACDRALVCRCENDETRLCTLQDGVCAGSFETCTDRDWPGCDSGTYGASYQIWETSCSDKLDNDCDNLTDCLDSDCTDSPACGFEERTVIYVTNAKADNANFASLDPLGFDYARRGADQVCIDLKPANLPTGCTEIHAFLSIASPNNEIEDLPRNYGYDPDEPIYWLSSAGTYNLLESNWAEMLDGTIDVSQFSGTGEGEDVYSGSYDDGTLYTLHCQNWSNSSGGQSGSIGCNATDSTWLDCGPISCNIGRRLRCAAICSQELNCTNGEDDDSDGQTDCADPDCVTDPTCIPTTETRTTIYIATNTYTGNLGGRAGADTICQTEKPGNLGNCSNIQAFISVNNSDEIEGMRNDVAGGLYQWDEPVYWLHSTNGTYTQLANDWDDMLDGTIAVDQQTGTGIDSPSAWTGSDEAGTTQNNDCSDWTFELTDNAIRGDYGRPDYSDSRWIVGSFATSCGAYYRLRCIAECQTENNCYNSLDDDTDGLIDCADPDCGADTGPSGEQCEPLGETTCRDGWDNDGDGIADCGDADCGCKTLVYLTSTTTNGDLASFGGGDPRRGADNFCTSPGNVPANFPGSCGTIHAFLSVDADDEIADLPGTYGYNVNEPIYWWHEPNKEYTQFANNWADMLDSTISTKQTEGAGVADPAWSGSNADGTVAVDNCIVWTTGGGATNGKEGRAPYTNATWLTASTGCNGANRVRCISMCLPETSCSDGVNDNGDSKTDCADPFCDGQIGPNGETCEPSGETICDDDWDNDGDLQTDCVDIDCVEESYCTAMLTRTMIYVTTVTGTGIMTNRAGADSRCTLSAPGNLPSTCSKIRAFISVDAADTIMRMPANYGYDPDMPVYWWNDSLERYRRIAKNWAKMLDSIIETSQSSGTGDSTTVWTGSKSDGSVNNTCSAWTNSAEIATLGNAVTTAGTWLSGAGTACSNGGYKTRCMAECDTENNCMNSLDDDSDGFTDCDDPDCIYPKCCGNSIIDSGEDCDDGANGEDTDACTDACTFTFCGDGIIQSPNGYGLNESCDVSLGGETCARQGCTLGGILSCLGDCSDFDTSGCMGCP